MTSDDEQQNDENPILARHRKEKKELRAKMTGMKKAAKSGNKQKQKEVNAECEKLEKDQEQRHRQELLTVSETLPPTGSSSSDPQDPPPTSLEAPPLSSGDPSPEKGADTLGGDVKESDDDETTANSSGGGASKFYKNFKISSKNAKKQAKKKEQEERLKLAAQADKEAAKKVDTEKAMEKAAIKAMLVEDRLKMIDIPADGDCLYAAIVHQLQEEGIEVSVRKLRKHCAQYLREHKEEFAPFIADTDVAQAGPDKASDWETYLQGIERCADVGGVWGGELELKAASQLYEKTIVVYRVDGGTYKIGEEFSSPRDRALRIVYLRHAYHLGEHYNSTCYAT